MGFLGGYTGRSLNIATIVAILSIAIVHLSNNVNVNVGAFNSYIPRIQTDLNNLQKMTGASTHSGSTFIVNGGTNINKNTNINRRSESRTVMSMSWLKDTFQALGLDFIQEKLKFQSTPQPNNDDDESKPKSKHGTVIRTAVKGYNKEASLPSSALYTTKKEARSEITVQPGGVKNDYNHYRTTALASTPDRALSILTTDVLKSLKSAGWDQVMDGDLGENVYIDGIDYTFFEVGKRYQFRTKNDNDDTNNISKKNDVDVEEGVIVEITERIEPCGNLCKLPYINNETLEPRARFEECKRFLLYLDEKDGLRGWYAKIIGDGGVVKLGDQVSALATPAAAQ